MKQRSVLLSGIIVATLLLLACGGGKTTPTTPPTSPPKSSGSSSSGGFDITIVNRSGQEICYVMISSSDEQEWGDDELGEDEKIADGGTRTFSVDAGSYDINVENCDQATLATAWNISQADSIEVGRVGATRLLFVNNSSKEVCYFFISPTTNEDWGDDWLGEKESVLPNNSRVFFVDSGTYDLMAGDCDGKTTLAKKDNVDLSSDATWTISD